MTTDVKEIIRRPRRYLPEIKLPDGEVLKPRRDFAHNVIGVCERSAARMNLPTTYIGGVAYVAENASLKIVADLVQRRNQPAKRHRQ